MITRFRVQNFKALRDVTLDLTPIHVLIGPNDSGKTSILEAIAALCRSVDHQLSDAFVGLWKGRELVWRGGHDQYVEFTADVKTEEHSYNYHLECEFFGSSTQRPNRQAHSAEETILLGAESIGLKPFGGAWSGANRIRWHEDSKISIEPTSEQLNAANLLHHSLANVHLCRWIPGTLALPAAINSARQYRMETSGFGLVTLLDDIISYDRDRFSALEEQFQSVFDRVLAIRLLSEPAFKDQADNSTQIPLFERADGKGLYFHFRNQTDLVPASQVSDGMLIVLAYLALLYLPEPPRVILVEEPENGIHPKRLQDVLTILRELVDEQSRTQVIMTTHSPYVVDMFKPDEVTLCQQQNDGSVSVRKLSESEAVRRQLDVFTLGEIWTAEGDAALSQSATPGMGGGG